MDMDIGTIDGILAIQAAHLRAQIDVAVLAKTNDAAKLQGEAVVALIESAATVTHGSTDGHVDVSA